MTSVESSVKLRFDTFELDESDARLRRNGVPIAVPPRAFAVLCTLARSPGQLVTKDALLDAVWGHRHVSESVLKTTISELRAALADDARQPRYIETASRRGYRFIGAAHGAAAVRQGAAPEAAAPAAAIIGREAELAELREAWRRAQAGERQLVWVTGEAGVGKSTLIDTFIRELGPGVATFGQCVEHFGTGEPYLPILEAVKELCRRDPSLVSAMRGVAPTWLVQMPWLVNESDRANLYTDVGGAHQDRMVREMRELMDRFTANRPLVFVLEDLHWSDAGTLRMMEHFARRPREVRLLWIATFRLTQVIAEDHPLRALRQELRLHKLCREIPLDPFSESEVGDFLARNVPQVAPKPSCGACTRTPTACRCSCAMSRTAWCRSRLAMPGVCSRSHKPPPTCHCPCPTAWPASSPSRLRGCLPRHRPPSRRPACSASSSAPARWRGWPAATSMRSATNSISWCGDNCGCVSPA